MALLARKKQLVGLDIGSFAIKLLELGERRGEHQLKSMGIEPLSPEAIVDGAIMDSSLVVDAIQKLNGDARVRNGNFATSVSGHSVIIKKIQLPPMAPEELQESIRWEAEQYIPFDIRDVRMDYVLLPTQPGHEDQMDVLLVAVKREKVNDCVSVISQAGKTAMLVDVDAFAIQNAYEANYEVDQSKVIALVNMGASVSSINILSGGQTVFWRDISVGGHQFTEALQRDLGLSYENAEALKRGNEIDRFTPAEAMPIMQRVSEEVAAELQKTFDFFAATAREGPLDQLVLSGGCALTAGLPEVLSDRFDLPVEIMNPLRRIEISQSDFTSEWVESVAPMMAVAVGLALRTVGD